MNTKFILFACIIYLSTLTILAQDYKVLESNESFIRLEFNFEGKYNLKDSVIQGKHFTIINDKNAPVGKLGEPWLPSVLTSIGIPLNSSPIVTIESVAQVKFSNKFILPVPKNDPSFEEMNIDAMDQSIYSSNSLFPETPAKLDKPYIMRYIRVSNLILSPYQFNPVLRELVFNKKIIVKIVFNANKSIPSAKVNDNFTDDFINSTLANSLIAKNWTAKENVLTSKNVTNTNYWYNPNREYFKIYLKNKGVYRISFQDLYNAGFRGTNVPDSSLSMYNAGVQIPILVNDADSNNIFNQGDYIEFVGAPPAASPNASLNIYNLSNVYWLTYQNDSAGLRYKVTDGTPTIWERSYSTALETLHYEKDSIYERLGWAPDDQRDYWFWGKAAIYGDQTLSLFEGRFPGPVNLNQDSLSFTLRVDMHGISASKWCPDNEHKAVISLSDQRLGTAVWNKQNRYTFERHFNQRTDSIRIFPDVNLVQVSVTGENCMPGGIKSDEIRINWFEFDYWKDLRVLGHNHLIFSTPPNPFGIYKFWTWQWQDSLIQVFIPSDNKIITKADWSSNDGGTFQFVDTVFAPKEYYCKSVSYYNTVDSVVKNINSDLRNLSNAADYIIIAHPKFKSIAEQLKAYRETTPLDSVVVNPRVKVVYVQDIYNEFTGGLLDPFALKYFVKYAFENWSGNAPAYIALVGDMSWDYRHIIPESRENYIPSLPFHTDTYGQAVSDNNIVAVEGDDYFPDLVISRISIETVDEGMIVLNKTKTYPADNSKVWKQNVLLVSSGLSLEDENYMGFNEASVELENGFVKPEGYKTTKIMRYPNKPEYMQYYGSGTDIRNAIDVGAVFLNYYGHGGGYQWDLSFIYDDIYQLNNAGRLPVISSITCYTAHFDNQDVFGEQFLKVPNKGCVGFWGSSGLTSWGAGTQMDKNLFDQIFIKKEYNIGKAIFKAKATAGYALQNQLAVLTYLGEPALTLALPNKADFTVSASNISLSKEKVLSGDTINVKIDLYNSGIIFTDSVSVDLSVSSQDTSYSIGHFKKAPFGENDSCNVIWMPKKGGQYSITVKINEDNLIPEDDHSDNIASSSFLVYDISEPNYYSPVDGYLSKSNKVIFSAADIGYYVDLQFKYEIEIDTNLNFSGQPIAKSGLVQPVDGILKWTSPELSKGSYFWRSRIFDGVNYGLWSKTKGFSIADSTFAGYAAQSLLFKQFSTYNMYYSDTAKCLVLNNSQLPPRPSLSHFLESLPLDSLNSVYDTTGMTTLTTDGKYIYFANNWYYVASQNNPAGNSRIYKVGTGFNGTQKGKYYGYIPNFFGRVSFQIVYHSDGSIYVGTDDPYRLLKINPESGDTSSVSVPGGLMRWDDARTAPGAFYLASDGVYIYNLAIKDSNNNSVYRVRILNPANNWEKVKPDMRLPGYSYNRFSSFFIADGYLYTAESDGGVMKKYKVNDGSFEDEWVANVESPFSYFYGWCYDSKNDKIYASSFRRPEKQKISMFAGKYTDASGTILSQEIGPASKWNSLSYVIDKSNSTGKYIAMLQGYNKTNKSWDTLNTNIPVSLNLDTVSALKYQYLRLFYTLTDTSQIVSNPLKLRNLNIAYIPLPELMVNRKNFVFTPDTTLQGFSNIMSMKIMNISKIKTDSLNVKFILGKDSLYYQTYVNVPADSSVEVKKEILTSDLPPATIYKMKAEITPQTNCPEYFSFNNSIDNSFYVARDSVKPEFTITVDGKEIINGDIVSANPTIEISLKDNSPLPLKPEFFTLVLNNIPVDVVGNDDTSKTKPKFTYLPYPNSQAKIVWTPKLSDGTYVLEVLAKDASGNFFDSTSSKTVFSVYNNFDFVNVLNYPNPFKDNTYFTFELRGDYKKVEDCKLRIFTVAGRLIKDITIPVSSLRSGFNKIFWDGKDQDGDNIANGTYFYKLNIKSDGKIKSVTQKLSKVK